MQPRKLILLLFIQLPNWQAGALPFWQSGATPLVGGAFRPNVRNDELTCQMNQPLLVNNSPLFHQHPAAVEVPGVFGSSLNGAKSPGITCPFTTTIGYNFDSEFHFPLQKQGVAIVIFAGSCNKTFKKTPTEEIEFSSGKSTFFDFTLPTENRAGCS